MLLKKGLFLNLVVNISLTLIVPVYAVDQVPHPEANCDKSTLKTLPTIKPEILALSDKLSVNEKTDCRGQLTEEVELKLLRSLSLVENMALKEFAGDKADEKDLQSLELLGIKKEKTKAYLDEVKKLLRPGYETLLAAKAKYNKKDNRWDMTKLDSKEAIQYEGKVFLPKRNASGEVKSLPVKEYQAKVKELGNLFSNDLKEYLENAKKGSSYSSVVEGQARPGEKIARDWEVTRDAAYARLRKNLSLLRDHYGIPKENFKSLTKTLIAAKNLVVKYNEEGLKKVEAARNASIAALFVPLALETASATGGLWGATTAASAAAAAEGLALMPIAFGALSGAIHASIDQAIYGGDYICRLVEQVREKGTEGLYVAPFLSSIPSAISLMTAQAAITFGLGSTATAATYVSANLATSLYFAHDLIKSGVTEAQKCYEFLKEAKARRDQGDEVSVKPMINQAVHACADSGIDLAFGKSILKNVDKHLDLSKEAAQKRNAIIEKHDRIEKQAIQLPAAMIRLKKLTDAEFTHEKLDAYLDGADKYFQKEYKPVIGQRPWIKIDKSKIKPEQVVGMDVLEFANIIQMAAQIEAPIETYTKVTGEKAAGALGDKGRFFGKNPDQVKYTEETDSPWCASAWCADERRHDGYLFDIYKKLTGKDPVKDNPNQSRGANHTPLQHKDARDGTEWSATSMYTTLLNHSTGELHTALLNVTRDEIRHLGFLAAIDKYLYGDQPNRRTKALVTDIVNDVKYHKGGRTGGEEFFDNPITLLEAAVSFTVVESKIRSWAKTLPHGALEKIFETPSKLPELPVPQATPEKIAADKKEAKDWEDKRKNMALWKEDQRNKQLEMKAFAKKNPELLKQTIKTELNDFLGAEQPSSQKAKELVAKISALSGSEQWDKKSNELFQQLLKDTMRTHQINNAYQERGN